ncbi:HNH endonuclease [Laceyella tengchongensis]|uniref:HNH endonuclease n=1 Tax=Laceyella tengchongensis TaxID=574699 RepID=A0AA46AH15_9BACL|nr:HNH endonuclease signature motif containing protein [Laceyella tengchongensis]SMP32881.1 HNH endonuclease [Laceyella tengchongensis]
MFETTNNYGEIWLKGNSNKKPLKYEILPNGCYKVVGRKLRKDGRGRICINGKETYIHRAVYEHYYGEIPKGFVIRHLCDFGGCINIEHMELGTQKDNVQDMIKSGRTRGKVNSFEKIQPDFSFKVNNDSPFHKHMTIDVKINEVTRCWEVVNRVPTPDGYFRVADGFAHRFMYKKFHGDIPKGYVVRHKCHNRACVAPHHLVIGTPKDNVEDKVKSGRQLKGSTHGMSKLTELQAIFIRIISPLINTKENQKAGLKQEEVAEWFGLRQAYISALLYNKSWKHLPNHKEIREIVREIDVS